MSEILEMAALVLSLIGIIISLVSFKIKANILDFLLMCVYVFWCLLLLYS